MNRIIKKSYIFLIYILFLTIYSFLVPKEDLNQSIYIGFYWFLLIILLYNFYAKQDSSIYMTANRYNNFDNLFLKKIYNRVCELFFFISTTIIITIFYFHIFNYIFDIKTCLFVLVNFFILLFFISSGIILDNILGTGMKWRIIFSIYIFLSFVCFPFLYEIPFFDLINITSAYYFLDEKGILPYISIILHLFIIFIFIPYKINKKWKGSL